jgi:D-xylose 1-dehydrogenase
MTAKYATYPSLVGRVVFVTGGASGIGADIVRAFHRNGSRVAFVDVQEAEGKALAKELGGKPLFIKCDLVDVAMLQSVIELVRQKLGPIGVLVNNAANDDRRGIAEMTVDYWDTMQAINLRPHFFASQAIRSHMKEIGGGSIINFSSIAWRFGADAMISYATAKSAVIGLTKALARGLAVDNIRVNSIEPGAVMTERQRKLWYQSEESVQSMVKRQLMQRVLVGEDIARTALFLAADDSYMITKQSIIVDAGLS